MPISLDKKGGTDPERSVEAPRPRPNSQSADHDESQRSDELDAVCREALELWLRWNSMYENVTEQLYEGRPKHTHLEDLMDRMDQVRAKAIRLSVKLIK